MIKSIAERKIRSSVKNPKLIQQRRNQIFETALKLFKKQGYHLTGLREVSKASGISLGNLYNYIKTKEDILCIVHQKAAEKIFQAINEKTSNVEDPLDKLNEMIEIELSIMDRYADLIMLIYQESHALSKESIHSLLENERIHVQQFQQVLEDGMAKGVFVSHNSIIVSNVIKMMIDGWVLKRWALRNKVSLTDMKKSILDLVQDGIKNKKMQKTGKSKRRNIIPRRVINGARIDITGNSKSIKRKQ